MSVSHLPHTSSVAQRREGLYGAGRQEEARSLMNNLTADHIALISKEGEKIRPPPWQSTANGSYKGTQPLRHPSSAPISERQRRNQDATHFDLRGDAAPINDEIYQTSLTSQDYQHRQAKPLPPVKHDGNINIPDMNPRYWRDRTMESSLYDTDFSNNKEVRHATGIHAVANERNEMRKRNVEDVRTTHFRFGNDPQSFSSETNLSYNTKNPLPAVGETVSEPRTPGGDQMTPAELTQKMLAQERDTAIFREGDYNVTVPKPDTTTFRRDYDVTSNKPYKSAAFIEPTRTQKGRFLVDSPLKHSVEQEVLRYPGLPQSEPEQNDLVPTVSALKQLFHQYGVNSCGYVSKPILKRVCDSLLHPIPLLDLEEIIKRTARGSDGSLSYQSFIDKFIDLKTAKQQDVNGNDIKDVHPAEITPVTSGQSSTPHTNSDRLGKGYQTTAHFKFGNDAYKLSSIYNEDFQQSEGKRGFSARKKPPPSSEVMHKLSDCVGFGESTKQSDFVNFKEISPGLYQSTIAVADRASVKNKRRHALDNVVLAGDKEKEAEDRQKSLSHSSYVTHDTGGQSHQPTAPPISKYNYLHTNGVLPYPSNTPGYSETAETFARAITRSTESKEKLRTFISDNKNRSKDGKKAHFSLGNDAPHRTSEAMEQFRTRAQEQMAAAGVMNQDEPGFLHQQVSKNTQDLLRDSMEPSTFQAQRMVKKTYYNSAPNPKDPLHVKMRGSLMQSDPERTGRLDKGTVKDVCREFEIPVSDYVINSLLQRCESDFDDDTVDYHKFVRSLNLEQTPSNDASAAPGHSVMMKDYKPLDQRSFTNAQLLTMEHMDRRPLNPMPTHFFHVDASGENQFNSLTSQDFIKPELRA